MNKCTLYAVLYIGTLLLLTGCLCEWATTLEIGGMSYGCGEEIPIFTTNDAVKTFVSAALICVWGIIGIHLVLWKCAALNDNNTVLTGDE